MLEQRGVDAIIAQGTEAGGHRGTSTGVDISMQPGLFALLPQVVDAVRVPALPPVAWPMGDRWLRPLSSVRAPYSWARPSCAARRPTCSMLIARRRASPPTPAPSSCT